MITQRESPDSHGEIKPIYKLLSLLYSHRVAFILTNILVGGLSLLLVFNLSLWYKSTAIVLAQGDNSSNGMLAMLAQVSPFPTGLGGSDKVDQYLGYLESGRILDSIIVKYDLQNLYEQETRFHTYIKVREFLSLMNRDDGTFSISFMAEENPELAAAIVNSFYDELYELVIEINQAKVSDFRSYLETSYHLGEQKLQAMLEDFRLFQEASGVINLEGQTKAALEGLAQIEAERMTNQIQLKYLSETLDKDDPLIADTKKRIEAINNEIKIYTESNEYSNIPLTNIPELSIEYMNNYREVEVQVKIVEYLALQLEQAKLEEQKQSAELYLVNPATPADYKSEPKRLNILVALVFFANVIFMLIIVFRSYVAKNKESIRRIFAS